MPLFTIIIPTFNRADLLPLAIDSLIAQEFGDFDVIIVDDGSTDDTPAVLDRISADPALHGRLTILRQANAGQGAARNLAISQASGEYCAFLDSDDMLFPWSLAEIARVIDEHCHPPVILGEESRFKSVEDFANMRQRSHQVAIWPDLYTFAATNVIRGTGETIAKTQLLREVGGFATARFMGEDTDLLLRLGTAGKMIKIQSPPTYGYRLHTGMFSVGEGRYRGLREIIRRCRAGVYPGGRAREREIQAIVARITLLLSLEYLRQGNWWSFLKLYFAGFGLQIRARHYHYILRMPLRLPMGMIGRWPRRIDLRVRPTDLPKLDAQGKTREPTMT